MKAGSLFSGIGGFDLGFQRAGIETIWQAEKEPFCRAILKTHFPGAQLFDDVRLITRDSAGAVDVITAGFPCQDLSVAGKRAGLEGSRSGLFWEVVRVLGEFRPAWFVLENVPGLFSSCEGRDFAVVLNALDELGYGVAWRVLNSQFFGVAQRRRRVFIVGRFGKPCPAEVLFESESGGGDFAAGGEARQDIAVPLTSGSGVTSNRPGRRAEDDFNLAYCLREDPGGIGQGHNTTFAVATAFVPHHDEHDGRGHNFRESNLAPSARGPHGADNPYIVQQAISSKWAKGSSGPAGDEHHNLTIAVRTAQTGANGIGVLEDGTTHTLDGTGGSSVCAPTHSNGVRDFAGLPQGLDSARYRALGNAVTVQVATWIGRRILAAGQ